MDISMMDDSESTTPPVTKRHSFSPKYVVVLYALLYIIVLFLGGVGAFLFCSYRFLGVL